MDKSLQKFAGVACLTLACGISVMHVTVSPTSPQLSTHTFLASVSPHPFASETAASVPSFKEPTFSTETLKREETFSQNSTLGKKEDPVSLAYNVTSPSSPSLLSQDSSPLTPPVVKKETLQLNSGKTLMALLTGAGIQKSEAQKALAALKPVYNAKQLKAGQDINIKCRHHSDKPTELVELNFHPDLGKNVSVKAAQNGDFKATSHQVALKKELRKVSFKINKNLAGSAKAKGIPSRIMNPLIRAFSYDIDFQRGLKPGDKCSIVFERHYDPVSGRDRMGDVLYARIDGKKTVQLYRFSQDGNFYNQHGESVKKSLMRTPVDGGKVNSKFGYRTHPISGFNQKHNGVDFRAPIGTPILAAGDGVVQKAFRNKGLGNYVLIKHNDKYSTAYGHLSKFARIKPGTKVKQGTVIGYVGQTGHATGPHLHFEVLKNGVHINPMLIASLSSGKLTGKDLKMFLAAKKSMDIKVTRLSETSHFALNFMPQDHS